MLFGGHLLEHRLALGKARDLTMYEMALTLQQERCVAGGRGFRLEGYGKLDLSKVTSHA